MPFSGFKTSIWTLWHYYYQILILNFWIILIWMFHSNIEINKSPSVWFFNILTDHLYCNFKSTIIECLHFHKVYFVFGSDLRELFADLQTIEQHNILPNFNIQPTTFDFWHFQKPLKKKIIRISLIEVLFNLNFSKVTSCFVCGRLMFVVLILFYIKKRLIIISSAEKLWVFNTILG